jgi:hypothetical protein
MKICYHIDKELVLFDSDCPERKASFAFTFRSPHPDHIALAAYLSFGCQEIEVASASLDFIKTCSAYGIKVAAAEICSPYVGGDDNLLCYGGGADSLAIHLMFPELFLVHDYETRNSDLNLEKFIHVRGGACVRTNLRDLGDKDYATPLSMFAPCVLMAADRGTSVIWSGTPREAIFCSERFIVSLNGKWEKLFRAAGLELNQSSALSEVGHMKIVSDYDMVKEARWCYHYPDRNCGFCLKCFRKEAILHAMGVHERSRSHWDSYDNSWVRGRIGKNTYPATLMTWAWASESLSDTWLKDYFPEMWWLPEANFQPKIWEDSQTSYGDGWVAFLQKCSQHLEVMSDLDSASFLSWWDRHLHVLG